MFFLIGLGIVLGCVLGGYAAMGGSIAVLWQPFEFVIILGAAIGALVIGTPKHILGQLGGAIGLIFKGSMFAKDDYVELLTMLFQTFKLAKSKGMLALESHVEKPDESDLFKNFPKFLHNHHALVFFCDYMRMMTMGTENPHQMEDLINEEMEVHHHERDQIYNAIQGMADGTPALGIVAAVLGVIKTMGHINSPPEILGHYIGGALVGTFAGVLIAYGVAGPMASSIKAIYDSEAKYYACIKAGILAYMNGYAPAVAVEFARKSIEHAYRPTFYELEEAINNLSASG
ncbi:MAG: flagellar motor stator protein MotA [Alphaproteobacteria bacterium]|nr:flagellar motor stator protein MotA [Alphaproteobacteria bacterium]